MPRPPADPYAPPPRHRDHSGAFVRIAILAVLIAGVGFGWMYFSSHQQTAGIVAPAEQQLADNGDTQVYQTDPVTAPAPEATPQTVAPAPTPAPVRRTAPQRSAPADIPRESVPPPTTSTSPPPADSTAPPSTPTPLPPTDQGE